MGNESTTCGQVTIGKDGVFQPNGPIAIPATQLEVRIVVRLVNYLPGNPEICHNSYLMVLPQQQNERVVVTIGEHQLSGQAVCLRPPDDRAKLWEVTVLCTATQHTKAIPLQPLPEGWEKGQRRIIDRGTPGHADRRPNVLLGHNVSS